MSNGSWSKHEIISSIIVVSIVALIIVFVLLTSHEGQYKSRLNIVTSALKVKDAGWWIDGRVYHEGIAIDTIKIWAIARDDVGNEYGTEPHTADKLGHFVIDSIPVLIHGYGDKQVRFIEIRAVGITPDKKTVEGKKRIDLTGWGTSFRHRIFEPVVWIVLSAVTFIASFICAIRLWGYKCEVNRDCIRDQLYNKYKLSVFLAVAFTFTTIMWISTALYKLDITKPDNDVYSIGFITIYKGRYIPNAEKEWLVSLTSPNMKIDTVESKPPPPSGRAATDTSGSKAAATVEKEVQKDIQSGMGAPLWVILLAVVGASLFTIILMIKTITDLPVFFRKMDDTGHAIKFNLSHRAKIREKIQVIVRHQFFILFAPIGAMFVYQLLIMSNAAHNHTTVAVAALASGVTPYWLLNKALQSVGGILEAKQDDIDELARDLLDLKGKISNMEESKAKTEQETDLINAAVEKLAAAKGDEAKTKQIYEELAQQLADGMGDVTEDYKAVMEKVKGIAAKVKAGYAGKTTEAKDAEKLANDLIARIKAILDKKIK